MQRMLLVISFLLSISACTPKPPDVPIFEEYIQRVVLDPVTGHTMMVPDPLCMKMIQEPACGHGVFIMSGVHVYVGEQKEHFWKGKPWSELKAESVFLPALESYAPIITYIINSCEKNHCSDDVNRFKVKLDGLNGVAGAIKNH